MLGISEAEFDNLACKEYAHRQQLRCKLQRVKMGNQNIEWKLEKDGTPVNMTDYGTFNFSSGSISAAFNVLGSYELIAYIEDETEKVYPIYRLRYITQRRM